MAVGVARHNRHVLTFPSPDWPVVALRRWGATSLRARVAGDDAEARAREIWESAGERRFTPEDPIWRVHADASMFTGGIRALLLQSLHPIALYGVEEHSLYRDDPWRRVQNTSEFLAATTFGPVTYASQVIDRVNRIHRAVRGVTDDGTPYAADDPHLLRWVHVAEVESFLTTYQRYGATPLSQDEADTYVAQTGTIAELLGVEASPQSEAELRAELEAYRPELTGSPVVRKVASFLLVDPPLPLLARPAYGAIAAGAVATLPGWARKMIGIPTVPFADSLVGRPVGSAATATIRWLMSDPSIAH